MAPPIMIERRLVAKRLKPEGWLCACVLLFLFWPLACVPCCLDDCKGARRHMHAWPVAS